MFLQILKKQQHAIALRRTWLERIAYQQASDEMIYGRSCFVCRCGRPSWRVGGGLFDKHRSN